MSITSFIKAYDNSDIDKLRKYITYPKFISTNKFINYVEQSFTTNINVCDILILIVLNQYDLNTVTINLIDRDNIDLIEHIFSYNTELVLDHKRLIPLTLPRGRISMAKLIYEYNHGNEDSYQIVKNLLKKYDFFYNKDEKSIDSFVIGLNKRNIHGNPKLYKKHQKDIISYINPAFWNNFAIKYATDTCDDYSVKKLLLCPEVDPGVDDNYPLRIATNNEDCAIIDELLKHPLVIPQSKYCDMDPIYITGSIEVNLLCIAEKLLRTNNDYMAIFKCASTIELLIKMHNDITYLAIKLGIFDVCELINHYPEQKRIIKKYLREFKMDEVYVCPSYELNLNPIDILKNAIKFNDIDLAKTIKNYPISINSFDLINSLTRNENKNCVIDYIYKEILILYNPNKILVRASSSYCKNISTSNFFVKIFNIVVNHPKLDCKYLYRKIFCDDIRSIILNHVNKNYGIVYYKNFLLDIKKN